MQNVVKPAEIDVNELMKKYDTEARYRTLVGWMAKVVSAIAITLSLFHLYTAGFGLLNAIKQRSVHLALVLVLVFLLYPMFKSSPKDRVPWYDFILAGVAFFAVFYHVLFFNDLILRSGLPTDMDLIVGFVGIALLLEATRRVSNPVLPLIAIFFLLYCYFGRYFPGLFAHRGYNLQRIINHMYLGTEGVFGTPLEVSATFVFLFIMFGSFLEQTGMGKFIIDLSIALAGHKTGGPAKVAVLSSGLMGTISGSSVANVCTTGMFTIPLMKSVGYKPYFAGAVEAVASTGGQIMPPVMGAAAFIMATMMEVEYLQVAAAAVIPALLYYAAVFVQVHLEASKLGLKGLPKEQLPKLGKLLREKGFLLVPLVAIIYFLLAGYTPLKAAFNGIIATLIIGCLPYVFKSLPEEVRFDFAKIKKALEDGARAALGVACACGTVGIVVGTATLTGLGLSIANAVVKISGGMLLPTLVMVMITSILLGSGLPTTANFIVTSTIAAPALFQLGVPAMATYMFVLYFGIAADLSPPVALAAYAGAGIAGSDPMKTGMTAMKLALAGFLVPFIYVFNPMLVLVGVPFREAMVVILFVVVAVLCALSAMNEERTAAQRTNRLGVVVASLVGVGYMVWQGYVPWDFVQAIATSLIGIFLLGMSTIGFYRADMPWWMRIVAFGGAIGLMIPGTVSDALGIAVLIAIHFLQGMRAATAPSVASAKEPEQPATKAVAMGKEKKSNEQKNEKRQVLDSTGAKGSGNGEGKGGSKNMKDTSGNGNNKKNLYMVAGVAAVIVLALFWKMSSLDARITAVSETVSGFEKSTDVDKKVDEVRQNLTTLSDSVAGLQKQMELAQNKGGMHEDAIRRGIETQRMAVQEMQRVLQVQEAMLRSQEGVLTGEMTPETTISVDQPAVEQAAPVSADQPAVEQTEPATTDQPAVEITETQSGDQPVSQDETAK